MQLKLQKVKLDQNMKKLRTDVKNRNQQFIYVCGIDKNRKDRLKKCWLNSFK